MMFCGGAAEYVKSYLKPFVDFGVDFVVFCAQLFWRYFLFECFRFGCGSVFVCTAYVESGPAAGFVVSVSISYALCGLSILTSRRHLHSKRCPQCFQGGARY